MEFSKLRDNAELSDVTVLIGSKETNLHKFPLCAKSEYFCEIAKSKSTKVDFSDFPGGDEAFSRIVDFCYNLPLKSTKDNIIEIRVGAGYLKMSGPGNLIEVTDKCLKEMLTSARLSRSNVCITDLLNHCTAVGDLAESEGVVDLCIDALIDCWVKSSSLSLWSVNVFNRVPSKFETKSAFRYTRDKTTSQHLSRLDGDSVKNLISLRPDWFAKLLVCAKDKGIQLSLLGTLAVGYISVNILHEGLTKEEENETASSSDRVTVDKENPPHQHPDCTLKESKPAKKQTDKDLKKNHPKYDDGHVLDKVLLALPEQAYRTQSITIEWLSKVLCLASAQSCQCKPLLVGLVQDLMHKLDPEDLCVMSPSVLHDVVQKSNDDKKIDHRVDQTCKLVDTYMNHLSSKGTLSAETFRLLASATSKSPRSSHDSLFNLLLNVLHTEKDNLTSDQIGESASLIDADLLSETCLQKAFEENIFSSKVIAKSALKLCARLREELLSHKYKTEDHGYSPYRTEILYGKSETGKLSSLSMKDKPVDCGSSDASHSSIGALKTGTVDLTDLNHITEPMTAAKKVLTTARQKLSSYPPIRPWRYQSVGTSPYTYQYPSSVDYEMSVEDDYDQSLCGLESRGLHYRDWGYRSNGVYFPYTVYSRF
ncbi:hypothetical protein Btru_034482 [Bulinus truncatus]|nr:hypothetical protein Btru_034482 [Bulinus truncatus]